MIVAAILLVLKCKIPYSLIEFIYNYLNFVLAN